MWPANNTNVSGLQQFQGILNGWNVADYNMYWTVDGGPTNSMPTNYTDYPHKEAIVDTSMWNPNPDGKYSVSYIAKTFKGREIARTSFSVSQPITENVLTSISTTTLTGTPAPVSMPTSVSTPIPVDVPSKPLEDELLYISPHSFAANQAELWRNDRPVDAAQMDKLASLPAAKWFGGWNYDVETDVRAYVSAAANTATLPVLVAYNIPLRDCDGYSAGGTSSADYINWIKKLAAGIGGNKAIVILEPDAIANLECLSLEDQTARLSLISQAVAALKVNPATYVYLDGGNPRWKNPSVIAERLMSAGVTNADGFSLNVSNFISTSENTNYGQEVSAKLSGKHFVIDTSRNGSGPTSTLEWCNPAGRSLGDKPTVQITNPLIDAYLWIKTPGESDGQCNGGPVAGAWWPEYALGLAERAAY